jgi:hypothetical protein
LSDYFDNKSPILVAVSDIVPADVVCLPLSRNFQESSLKIVLMRLLSDSCEFGIASAIPDRNPYGGIIA